MLAQAIQERAEAQKKAEQGDQEEQGEVELEEVEPVEVLEDTVVMLYLGEDKSQDVRESLEHKPWIFDMGEKPEEAAPAYLKEVGKEPEIIEDAGDSIDEQATVYEQATAAIPKLRKHSIDLEEGPHADHEGLVQAFVNEVFKGTNTLSEKIERLIDVLRPFVDAFVEGAFKKIYKNKTYRFKLNGHFADIPDELPTAGRLLGQQSRRVIDPQSHGKYIIVADLLESYILAVSALRRVGVKAYNAYGLVSGTKGETTPLVAIIDEKAPFSLITFALQREHATIGAVNVLSDQAMLGATYALLAKYRTSHLGIEMVKASAGPVPLTSEEIGNQLERIGDSLVEAHSRWPGSHMISDTLDYIYTSSMEASIPLILSDTEANKESLVLMNPEFAIPDVLEQHVQQLAAQAAGRWRAMAHSRLDRRIPKHPASSE
jgi:hypothetical protein